MKTSRIANNAFSIGVLTTLCTITWLSGKVRRRWPCSTTKRIL